MSRYLLAAAMLCASPALAQEFGRIDTVSGPAVLTRVGTDMVLTVGGQSFTAEGMMYADFVQKLGDVVPVGFSSGGTACPGLYAWLDPRPGSIRLTEIFGTCSDLPEVSWNDQAVIVTLPSMVAGDPKVDFLWDGKSLAVTERPQAPAALGLVPGGPAEAWVGLWAGDLIGAVEWQAVLGQVFSASDLEDLKRMASGPGHPFEIQGDWVVTETCQAHNCGATTAIMALSRRSGALVVALWEEGRGTRVFGDSSGGVPVAVAELMAKR